MRHSIAELQARATEVRVDNDWVYLRLEDDREIRFPIAKNRRLRNATPEELADVELICGGTGIHWQRLDEDLSVAGILEGRFGID